MPEEMKLVVGEAVLAPVIKDGFLHSLGQVRLGERWLRSSAVRFLPWFDTYRGDVFRRLRLERIESRGPDTIVHTTAVSDPDVIFQERRDSSGDLVFRDSHWDSEPLETKLRIVLRPAQERIDDYAFSGFTYHFEVEGDIAIHRLLDRQTWEIDGHVDGLHICLRNWSHKPMVPLQRDEAFSSGGLVESFVVAFPGNLWARWSMFPPYDFLYRKGSSAQDGGVLLTYFDRVSLIRSLAESVKGEATLRVLDLHGFTQGTKVQTNPKTVLFHAGAMDDVEAANLWTRMYDREMQRTRTYFDMPEEDPPYVSFDQNQWVGFHFDHSYEQVIDVAAEFGADYVFIDPVWENEQTLYEQLKTLLPAETLKNSEFGKIWLSNMCNTLDWRVSQVRGGEAGLKRLVERAKAKGIKLISWICGHASQRTYLGVHANFNEKTGRVAELGKGPMGIFASRESGRHPDTGYPNDAWALNLNAPICDYLRERVLETCRNTGLQGFLWDSYSNLGWWQIDYANGDMQPQFDKHAGLYADYVRAGLYIRPEGLPIFSNHCGLGMAAGNLYPTGLLATYGYNCEITFDDHINTTRRLITGEESLEMLFHWIANRHMPVLHFHHIPREQWNPQRVQEIKALIAAYKRVRQQMKRRTILQAVKGVRWEDGSGQDVLFTFCELPREGHCVDVISEQEVTGKVLPALGIYWVSR